MRVKKRLLFLAEAMKSQYLMTSASEMSVWNRLEQIRSAVLSSREALCLPVGLWLDGQLMSSREQNKRLTNKYKHILSPPPMQKVKEKAPLD